MKNARKGLTQDEINGILLASDTDDGLIPGG